MRIIPRAAFANVVCMTTIADIVVDVGSFVNNQGQARIYRYPCWVLLSLPRKMQNRFGGREPANSGVWPQC